MKDTQNQMQKTNNSRLYEFDLLRGLALAIMLFWHTLYDLDNFFNVKTLPYDTGFLHYLGRFAVTLFIMVAAVSCSFSRNNVKRGFKILGLAMVITIATHLYDPEFGIKFGILHFMGFSILLYPLFASLNSYLLITFGTIVIGLGQYFNDLSPSNNYFFLFNLTNLNWVSSDYYPMFPWFGVFLYGIAVRKIFYPTRRSILPDSYRPGILAFIGRNTLWIYLLHQPVIIGVLNIGFWFYNK